MMALAGECETVAFANHPSRSLFSSDPEKEIGIFDKQGATATKT